MESFCMKRFSPVKVILAAVLAVVLFSGCSQATNSSIKSAARLNLQSGQTGKAVNITDAATIKKVTDNMNQVTFRKGNKTDDVMGWGYRLRWFDKDGKSIMGSTTDITVQDANLVKYGGYYYSTDSGKLDTALYDQLLKSATEFPPDN